MKENTKTKQVAAKKYKIICGVHGCHVTASDTNIDCDCLGCFGMHCHDCVTFYNRCLTSANMALANKKCDECQRQK